ncbi:MAG: Clp protease N-terminal domain-containing protein, partial [Flavicella sp.]|nr:Clp protease N-terminal domain-containing protein [Flavicella sp.]
MDDNFSQKVKDVIGYSKEEALRLSHDFIGTEHLVLGILRKAEGKAIDILTTLDVNLDYLKKKIEALNPSEPSIIEDTDKKKLHLTRQAEKALKTTFLEAKLYQDTAVNTAHLLLCILRNENDPTTKLLNNFEINYNDVKSLFKQLESSTDDLPELPT